MSLLLQGAQSDGEGSGVGPGLWRRPMHIAG